MTPLRFLAALAVVVLSALAVSRPAIAQGYPQVTERGFVIPAVPPGAIARSHRAQTVSYASAHKPGTIVVDPAKRFMYVVQDRNRAVRYGISVGSGAFGWSGEAYVARKAAWPRWTPPREMIGRAQNLERYSGGMEPGPLNPMGARALYLYQDGRDTLYRIHGTSEYWSIGKAASAGCIRVINQELIELFDRVPVGTKVVVLPAGMKWTVRRG